MPAASNRCARDIARPSAVVTAGVRSTFPALRGVIGVVNHDGSNMPKGFKDYLAEANAVVETCSVQDALRLHGRDDWVFVDVRDAGEIEKEGRVPGAVHASRGLLEFRIDPASPMHDPALAPDPKKRFVFYCGTGGRSVLAAQRAIEMGMGEVISMAGGFNAWKSADGPVERE